MTTGVRAIWRDDDGKVDEIEYFCGIDVAQLEHIPDFTKVPAVWPRYGGHGGTPVVYTVDARCEPHAPGEVRLVIAYDLEKNLEISEEWEIYPGENTIILKQGHQHGRCEWRSAGSPSFEEVAWEAFDLGTGCARTRSTYRGSRREASFRRIILACDGYRCVLTGEATISALEAAHLIPAANGENDVPSNGITLRADLHRLFDAGLFTLLYRRSSSSVGPRDFQGLSPTPPNPAPAAIDF